MVLRRIDTAPEDFHPALRRLGADAACDQRLHALRLARGRRARRRADDRRGARRGRRSSPRCGTREVVLIGGEAYLHPGFLDDRPRARERAASRPTMTTGGRGITASSRAQMADAGHARGVGQRRRPRGDARSDARARRGSFAAATAALAHLRDAGHRRPRRTPTSTGSTSATSSRSTSSYARCGIGAWQVQITAPLGRAADRPELLLQPWDLLDLVPRIAALKERAFARTASLLMPGNNLGYFGPEEALLRSPRPGDARPLAGLPGRAVRDGHRVRRRREGLPVAADARTTSAATLRERLARREIWDDAPELALHPRAHRRRPLGLLPHLPLRDDAAWAAAASPRTRSSAGPATTPTATSARARSRSRASASASSRGAPRPASRSTTACSSIVVEPLDAPDPKPELKREYVKRAAGPGEPSRPHACFELSS